MSKSEKIKDRPQCIVLPFQPDSPEDFNGVGLALHFLLGNVMVLHTGLKECWFGWRVKKIFPEKTDLKAYCREKEILVDLHQVSTEQNVRFWLYGKGKIDSGLFEKAAAVARTLLWRKTFWAGHPTAARITGLRKNRFCGRCGAIPTALVPCRG